MGIALRNSVVVLALLAGQAAVAQGVILPTAGAVNRSMGGAGVAASLDAASSLYWNPSTMTSLARSEMSFSSAIVYPTAKLSSRVGAGAAGPGVPPAELAGVQRSDSGVGLLPNFAVMLASEESPWRFGFGVFAAGGIFGNVPGSATNPFTGPPPPAGLGSGPVFSSLNFTQFTAAAAAQLTDRLSFGVAPLINAGAIQISPAAFAAPDDANGDGTFTYPDANNTRLHWGLGVMLGLNYVCNDHVSVGLSYKSPQWFERITYNSADELGAPRTLNLRTDLPAIVSFGTAVQLTERVLLACDVRYIDYDNANFLGEPAGFLPNGVLTGLGYESVWAVALGVQRSYDNGLVLRGGYIANTAPLPDSATSFNAAGANNTTHGLFCGFTVPFTDAAELSIAYTHAFRRTIQGPIVTPAGPLADSSVAIDQLLHGVELGLSVVF